MSRNVSASGDSSSRDGGRGFVTFANMPKNLEARSLSDAQIVQVRLLL